MEPVNQFRLIGRLVECEPLRYTPAGIAICQGIIEHESTQTDNGHDRQVRLTMTARFAGTLAEKVSKESLGCNLAIQGFIAAKRVFKDGSNSATVLLHVSSYELQA